MKRREFSSLLLSATVGSLAIGPAGCATFRGKTGGGKDESAAAAPIVDAPRRPGKPLLFVVMPDAPAFRDVRRTMSGEVQKDFDVTTFVMSRATTPEALGQSLNKDKPTCVVLMDNPAVKLYGAFERSLPKEQPRLPVLMVMCSFVEELRGELANATGIAYEVPGLSAFVNLRAVVDRNIARVGVVYRPDFRRFIARQRTLAEKEEIDIVSIEVGNDASDQDIQIALKTFRRAQRVDALWVLNDNALLKSGRFIQKVWRPELQILRVPVVVSAPSLVTSSAPFGTFAVVPDHEALGVQAANMLFDLADDDWKAKDRPVELPLSTQNIADLKQIRETFGLKPNGLQRIDKAID